MVFINEIGLKLTLWNCWREEEEEEEEKQEDVRVYLYMTNHGQDFWMLFMKVYVTML